METTAYRVELDFFQGPMDLLLYLVRRDELDILDLPVAKISLHFQQFLDIVSWIDIDMAGEFILTASTLAEMKSQMALPQAKVDEETEKQIEDDPRADLVQQLLEYKKYKDAALKLKEHADLWLDRFPRLHDDKPSESRAHGIDLIKEVELWDLVSALSRIMRKKIIEQEATLKDDDTPVHIYVEQIGVKIRAEKQVLFQSLFEKTAVKGQITGMFLAILELIRHHGFRAVQTLDFGEIWMLPPMGEMADTETRELGAGELLPPPQHDDYELPLEE
jgi:segregation and condensation protein A